MIFRLVFSFAFLTPLLVWWYLPTLVQIAVLRGSGLRFGPVQSIALQVVWLLLLAVVLVIGGLISATAARRLPPRGGGSPLSAFFVFTAVLALHLLLAIEVVEPLLARDERMHRSNWPAGIEVVELAACAEAPFREASMGEIRVEIANRSASAIRVLDLSVETGKHPLGGRCLARIRLANVQAGESRRVAITERVGYVNVGKPHRWTHARLLWDRLEFAGGGEVLLDDEPVEPVPMTVCGSPGSSP